MAGLPGLLGAHRRPGLLHTRDAGQLIRDQQPQSISDLKVCIRRNPQRQAGSRHDDDQLCRLLSDCNAQMHLQFNFHGCSTTVAHHALLQR
ncbi:hypothetical protein BDA96_07G087000 [Sorghum bicolor]|uniref:Uncharacterized protein n=2 Tax=Sorghum bicolor TaxID=4558 RepID=A0A921QJG7_SORBI|nr:hypothetical protein BDA96_07G087000 [Sorghum bicolor]KXG24769.1 hypothetical protein SORBI_3007G083700 [Sorghum bicolor]